MIVDQRHMLNAVNGTVAIPADIPLRAFKFTFGILGLFVSFLAIAQDFPSRPVRLLVAAAAGASADIVARVLAPEMSKPLGKPIVVENRPGAGYVVGLEYVVNQPADGYLITLVPLDILASLPVAVKELRFNPLKDIPPFIGLAESRWVLGSSSQLPWKSFGELIAKIRENPGKYNWGATTYLGRLLTEVVLQDKGLNAVHIPYAGAAGAGFTQALMNGSELQFGMHTEGAAAGGGDRFRVFVGAI